MCFHISSPLSILPTGFGEMLESFKDLVFEEIPKGLPPMKGIKHHIDFILGATLPNKAAYMTNPEESKEIQQVSKLVEKALVHESKSPCAMPVILVPKKMGYDAYIDLWSGYHQI
ncbi:hypothetical protein CR513_15724, partial [Mucuna pruriens]